MKKLNNKYRNNNYNNQVYSLNYKFDSTSPAGKITGTALDLIKKYNDLAKDSVSNNDYVTAEVYRQYAEHYRKIVTEINEKKMQRNNFNHDAENVVDANVADKQVAENDNGTEAQSSEVVSAPVEEAPVVEKKAFTVIEISDAPKAENEPAPAPKKKVYRRKSAAVAAAAEV